MLGPPGAGKGTLCSYLEKQYSLAHFSVGDNLREWMRNNRGTPLAVAIRDKLENQGFLNPEDIDPFLIEAMETAQARLDLNGLLIDGHPRCIQQLESYDSWLYVNVPWQPEGFHISHLVLSIRVGKSTARLRYCDRARDQMDNEEKFEKRFAEYERETLPVEEIYRKRGVLVEVDANGTKDENVVELEQKLMASQIWQTQEPVKHHPS